MHPLFQLVVVVSVIIGMYMSLLLVMRLIAKRKLYNLKGILLASFSLGTVFSIASLAMILISKKFQDWSFVGKLLYAGEIFIWVFFAGIILIYLAFRRSQDYLQRNRKQGREN